VRVFLVRHAEAEPGEPGEPDELRRLTSRGRKQAQELGKRLAKQRARPAVVISSPLLRARETAEAIAEKLHVDVEQDDRLAPGCTVDAYRDTVRGRGETVITVGHQPDCGEIAAALTGTREPPFPPAGVFEAAL